MLPHVWDMARATPKPEQSERRIQLRVSAPLYAELHAASERELRSLNATVVVLLTEALAARAKKRGRQEATP